MVDSGRKWGIYMLIGEYHHTIDDKGRLIIPSKLREELGYDCIVTRGLDNCLFVYPKEEWDLIVAKLKLLPFTKKDARSFMRFFLSGATVCDFDKQGRINITSPLIEYADLTKECIVIGVNDRLEIWSKANWENFFHTHKDNLSDIAEDLFQNDSHL